MEKMNNKLEALCSHIMTPFPKRVLSEYLDVEDKAVRLSTLTGESTNSIISRANEESSKTMFSAESFIDGWIAEELRK